jgi:peptidoglycan hydrolase-like protein with peptidoglycan-binding domain
MSYYSRVYRHRNPNLHDENAKEPFFSKKNGSNDSGQKAPFFQAKLSVNEPGDKYELEADSVANAVVNNKASSPVIQQKRISSIQRLSTSMEDEKLSTNDARMARDKEIQEKPVRKIDADPEKEKDKETTTTVQTKQDTSSNAASPNVSSKIENSSGKGNQLPQKTLQEMSASFGVDFSDVKVHNDSDSVNISKELQAQAFTHGRDIYFNEGKYSPESSEGKFLLAHELTHVVQQGGIENAKTNTGSKNSNVNYNHSSSSVFRQGLLTPGQEQSAVLFNNRRFDLRSRMIIQIITGAGVDGVIGSQTVEAIAAFQNANGLTDDGKVGEDTLNVMLQNRVADGSQDQAIQLVVDFFNLNLSQTLSITFDPTLLLANTTFEPGGQRVIQVGTIAFLSAGFLRTVIASQLALPAPAVPAAGPRPNHLTTRQEIAASNFNRSKFTDLRSVRGIQGFVGSAPDGSFGPDTAERIAEFQNANALSVDGKVGEQTLRVMVRQLDAAGQQNLAIRLIIDFFNLSEHNALLDISFDRSLTTANASTGGDIPGPSSIRVGPPAFAQGFEGLVHTIAHELDHVRQRREGILNQDEREFLGEEVEILSIGTPEENVAGFFDDARRALRFWNRLPAADQRRLFNRFTGVRNKVRQRFNAATAAEQATHQPTLNGYNAVVRP